MKTTKKSNGQDLASIRRAMQELHGSGRTHSHEWRRNQLLRMKRMLLDNKNAISAALYKDLGKSVTEADNSEYALMLCDLNNILKNLKSWMRPRNIAAPMATIPSFSSITPVPKAGPACLVIAPFNYPFSLALQPAVGALAAGNPVVVKPSELCPNTADLIQRLCDEYFEPDVLKVVQGGIPETQKLLQESWGLIFFTGSERVGKIVAENAAKTLTPTVMELGGKCPAYVDAHHSSLKQTADRIIWAKLFNVGQTCAAIDTLFVHKKVVDLLVPQLLQCLEEQFPEPRISSELGRIVSEQHAQRHFEMIEEIEKADGAAILCGGTKHCNVKERYIAPTMVLNPPVDCRLMQEEIFGPLLPIIAVDSDTQAIEKIRNMYGTPLCLYAFTSNDKVFNRIRVACPAGSLMRNDALMHLASSAIPFGGLGTSGYGNYHGKYSFETFSHLQPCMTRLMFPGADIFNLRCHPYGDSMPHEKGLVKSVSESNQKRSPSVRSFKNIMLDLALTRLPDVPVLHLQQVALAVVLLGILLIVITRQSVAAWVAGLLESVARWLRAF